MRMVRIYFWVNLALGVLLLLASLDGGFLHKFVDALSEVLSLFNLAFIVGAMYAFR